MEAADTMAIPPKEREEFLQQRQRQRFDLGSEILDSE